MKASFRIGMFFRAVAVLGVLLVGLPSVPAAHEIPASVTVSAFARAEGQRLRLLVRVPLESMRDTEIPFHGDGYLDIERVSPELPVLARLWIANYVRLYEDGRWLGDGEITATRITLPSDKSFITYQTALANVRSAPLSRDVELPWQQAMLDVLIEYPISSQESRFSIEPGLAHLGVKTATVLRFVRPDGGERVFQYMGNPGVVRLDPRWHQAALNFAKLGFFHILDGIDHLLFILCLLIPFRQLRPLIVIVTSFTVAHSITLIASAFGFAPNALWFPPLIEALIALSIVYMAFENIVGAKLERRWLVAFGFGLIHGFGFSFALRESLQFAGGHLTMSLLSFNLGVEIGQIFVLLLAIPLLDFVFRRVVSERMGTIILSALIAHTAWHWMIDRGSALSEYDFRAPALNAAFWAATLRTLMLLLLVSGVVWLLYRVFGRVRRAHPQPEPTVIAGAD